MEILVVRRPYLLILLALLAHAVPTSAQVFYRANGTGVFPAAAPPVDFGEGRGVAWKTPMPNWSNSSPVVINGRVFVCSEPNTLLCADAATGKILWQRENDHLELLPPQEAAAARAAWKQEVDFEQELQLLRYDWLRLTKAVEKDPNDKEAAKDLQALKDHLEARELYVQTEKVGYHKRSKESLERDRHRSQLEKKYGLYFDTWSRWDRWIGMSMPTPVSDGRHVWAAYATNTVVCYDTEGNRKWMKWFPKEPDRHYRYTGDPYWNSYPRALFVASPILVDGRMVVQVGRTIRALDAQTGEELWKGDIDRYLEYCVGTPAAMTLGDVTVIITCFGDVRRLSDGKLLATGVGFSPNASSPTVHGDVVYFQNGKNPGGVVRGVRNTIEAVRLSLDGTDRVKTDTLWSFESDGGYISPIYHDGLLYHEESRKLTVRDAATGQIVNQPVPINNQYSSLTLTGNYLFVVDCDGHFTIWTAGRETKHVADCVLKMDDPVGAKLKQRKRISGELHWQFTLGVPFFQGSRMYVRSYDNLYCIGPH